MMFSQYAKIKTASQEQYKDILQDSLSNMKEKKGFSRKTH